jgi:hypothetical protein
VNDSVSILSLALQAVSARMVLLIALLMAFSLFCWSMAVGTTLSLYIAGSFAVLVFLPILLRGESRVRPEVQ